MKDAKELKQLGLLLGERLISEHIRIIEDENCLSAILGTFFGEHQISDDKEREKIIKFCLPHVHPDKVSLIDDSEQKTALARIIIEYHTDFENNKIYVRSQQTRKSKSATMTTTSDIRTDLATNKPAHPEVYTPEGWNNYENRIMAFTANFFTNLGISYTAEEIQKKANALKTVWKYHLLDIRMLTHADYPQFLKWLPCLLDDRFQDLLKSYDTTDIEIAIIAHLLKTLYQKNNIKTEPNIREIRQELNSTVVDAILNDLITMMPSLSEKIRGGEVSLSKIFDGNWNNIVKLNNEDQYKSGQYCNPTAFYPPQDFEHFFKEYSLSRSTIYRERKGNPCDWLLFPMNINSVDSALEESYLQARYNNLKNFGALSDTEFPVLPTNVIRQRDGYFTRDKILWVFGEEGKARYGISFQDFSSEEELNDCFANLSRLIQYYKIYTDKIFIGLQYTKSGHFGTSIGYYLVLKKDNKQIIKNYDRTYSTHGSIKIDIVKYHGKAQRQCNHNIEKFFGDIQVDKFFLQTLPFPDRTRNPNQNQSMIENQKLSSENISTIDFTSQNIENTSTELSQEQLLKGALALYLFSSEHPDFCNQLQNSGNTNQAKIDDTPNQKISPYLNLTTFSNSNKESKENIEETDKNEEKTSNYTTCIIS